MTNKEFYSDKLMAVALGVCCIDLYVAIKGESCADKSCSECEFSGDERILQWLNAEYEEPEPPLLENGDGLKTGDWIMVKHYKHDTWKKRQFLCYWNGRFFATKGYWEATSFKDFNSYTIARLLEDGE